MVQKISVVSVKTEKRNTSKGITFFPENFNRDEPFHLNSLRNFRVFHTNGKRSASAHRDGIRSGGKASDQITSVNSRLLLVNQLYFKRHLPGPYYSSGKAPISTCKVSTLISIHFLENQLREFDKRSKHFLFGNHFINSHYCFS